MSTRIVIRIQEENGVVTPLRSEKLWAEVEIQYEVTLLAVRCEDWESNDFIVDFHCRHRSCEKYSCRVVELPSGLKPLDDSDNIVLVGNCEDHYCCVDRTCPQY